MDLAALAGHSILLAEDEVLVRLDIADMLTALGARVAAVASVRAALAAAQRLELSTAVLDIRVGGEDCSPICEALSERGVQFVFHTGYPRSAVQERWNGAPVIAKPATPEQIIEAVVRACYSPQKAA